MAEANPMATLFDRLADTYDAVGVDFIAPIAEGLVLELDPQPGERALDVGCGKGAALVPLAAAVGATGAGGLKSSGDAECGTAQMESLLAWCQRGEVAHASAAELRTARDR